MLSSHSKKLTILRPKADQSVVLTGSFSCAGDYVPGGGIQAHQRSKDSPDCGTFEHDGPLDGGIPEVDAGRQATRALCRDLSERSERSCPK